MGSLGITAANFIVQMIAFIIFIAIFWRFALGPITSMLGQRRPRLEESMSAAERMQKELAETQAQNEQVLLEARRESQQILAATRENGEQLLARAREQSQVEAQQLIEKAQATIEAERQQAWMQLRQDVADLAIAAATKIVRHELNRQEQTRLIEETLAEAGSNGRTPA